MKEETSEKPIGIPKIKFFKKYKAEVEFEVLPLDILYERHREGLIGFDIHRFHRPRFNQIILIDRGFGRHFIDFCEYSYEPGDVILIARNQVHAFDVVEPERGLLILFTTEFLVKNMTHKEVRSIHNLFGNILGPPVLKKKGEMKTVRVLFHALETEYAGAEHELQIEVLRHLLVALVIRLNALRDEEQGKVVNSDWLILLNRLDEAMKADSLQLRDARKYASRLGCSYKHLNTVCKSLIGQTAKRYIDEVIVLEIMRCLATTSLSGKELCWRFGFDEETNFVKFFMRNTGMSPKVFRNLQFR